jgi:type II secretory pathway pseudopilin PulG
MFRPARYRRGFTLIELGVAMTVGMVLIVLGLRFVTSLIDVHAANIQVNASQRGVATGTERLRTDVEKAVICAADNIGVPVRTVAPDTLQVWANLPEMPAGGAATSPDADPDVIVWRWNNGAIQRAEILNRINYSGTTRKTSGLVDPCTVNPDLSAATWRTVITGVQNPSTAGSLFTGTLRGTAGAYPATACVGSFVDGCLFDAISVSFSVQAPGAAAGTAIPTRRTLPVPLSTSRILR